MESLVVNGVEFPPIAYNGATKTRSKVWSRNTGRNDYAEMQGTILAIKTKWEFTFVPLSEEQVELVDGVISDVNSAYVPIVFTRNSGAVESFIGYSGDITYPLLWDTENETWYKGVKVSFIEK